MNTVMLVDDEDIIRTGVAQMVPWRENDLNLVYQAKQGLEALEYLRENPVDIAITDIRMPVMDGIELIKSAKEQHIGTRFIMLTGFNEFEYARSVMLLSVRHYLLKPCSEQDIIEACHKTAEEISESVNKENEVFYQSYQDICVNEIIRIVNENVHDPNLNLKWIARNKLFMNENYLSKLFQRVTGIKFTQYLTDRRISKAKTMIQQEPDVKLVTLCHRLGFENNPAYFSTLFKTQSGMTVTQFRNRI